MYKRMLFGLCNTPTVFQQMMERVLKPVNKMSSVYIDYIAVYSKSWDEHMCDLRDVLCCLQEAGLCS